MLLAVCALLRLCVGLLVLNQRFGCFGNGLEQPRPRPSAAAQHQPDENRLRAGPCQAEHDSTQWPSMSSFVAVHVGAGQHGYGEKEAQYRQAAGGLHCAFRLPFDLSSIWPIQCQTSWCCAHCALCCAHCSGCMPCCNCQCVASPTRRWPSDPACSTAGHLQPGGWWVQKHAQGFTLPHKQHLSPSRYLLIHFVCPRPPSSPFTTLIAHLLRSHTL